MTLTKDNTTIYVTRSLRNELQYVIFLHCIENLQKYLPDFHIVIICDNEKYTTDDIKQGDKLLTENNVQFITSEFPTLGEWLPFYYHLKNHPTEYMLYIHDNTLITKEIDFDKIEEYINKYGLYHLSVLKRQCYPNIKQVSNHYYHSISFYPFIKKFLINHSYIDPSQGGQCFTSWNVINKINEKFNVFNNFMELLNTDIPPRENRAIIEHFYAEMCYDVMESDQLTESLFVASDYSQLYFLNKFNQTITYSLYLKHQSEINPDMFIHFSFERF